MKTLICVMSLLLMLSLNAQELTMVIDNPQINGNLITYDVSAENFTDMVGMQYSITYDPDVLEFVSLENLNLPSLDLGDFNTNLSGLVLNAWIETTLTGATLANGVPIYQIVFEMLTGAPGDVCFSEDPVSSEFITTSIELASFTVVDDCHSVPFQIFLNLSSLEDIASRYGLSFTNPAHSQTITFSLEEARSLELSIFDLTGKRLIAFPNTKYQPGNNALVVGALLPGIYILTTEIDQKPVAVKIVYE